MLDRKKMAEMMLAEKEMPKKAKKPDSCPYCEDEECEGTCPAAEEAYDAELKGEEKEGSGSGVTVVLSFGGSKGLPTMPEGKKHAPRGY